MGMVLRVAKTSIVQLSGPILKVDFVLQVLKHPELASFSSQLHGGKEAWEVIPEAHGEKVPLQKGVPRAWDKLIQILGLQSAQRWSDVQELHGKAEHREAEDFVALAGLVVANARATPKAASG